MRVLVIGQGLAGTLISHAALAQGWDCHVLDAGLPSASSVAAGMFNPMSFRRIVEVWEAESHLTAMTETYRSIELVLGESLLHHLPIHKRIPNADYAKLWNQQSSKLRWIEPLHYEANRENEGVVNGGGWLNLPRLIALWQRHLTELGRFEKRALHTQDTEDLRTGHWDALIDCRGAHLRNASEVPNMDLRANRGEVLTIALQSGQTCNLPNHHILNFGKWTLPVGHNAWRLGASYEWKREDHTPDPETGNFLMEAMKTATDSQDVFTIRAHDVGIRPVSKDRRPMVGPCPKRDNWYLFNGLGTRGVLIGPKWAHHMIELLQGNTQTPDIVNPKRLLFPS